ncbi:MAG: nitrile hydratase subunit alpha [Candidatus Nitrosopolaris sp.]
MTKNAPMVEEITDFEVLEVALRELTIEKGLFTAEDHRQYTELAEEMGPAPASRLVAKAWTDSASKKRALEDPIAASLVVTCTLCSCYPRSGTLQNGTGRRTTGVVSFARPGRCLRSSVSS